jgi:hypothetical protein
MHVRNKEAKECVGLILLRGAMLLLACSGTACRTPTEETARAKRTMFVLRVSIGELRRVTAWGTGRNACATKRQIRIVTYWIVVRIRAT